MENINTSNGVFITYEYNNREIVGIDQFDQELEKCYSHQGKGVWLPSCSEGGELFLKIFFETDWKAFATSAVLGGLLWDVVKIAGKNFVLEPLAKALVNLREANKDNLGLKLERTSFIFNDIEIVIHGLTDNFKDEIELLLNQIDEKYEDIEKQNNGFPIMTIEVPFMRREDWQDGDEGEEYMYEYLYYGEISLLDCYWKVVFQDKSEMMYKYTQA